MSRPQRLYRSEDDRMIAGVCGGLATYLDVDPTIVRIVFVALVILPIGGGLLLYLILWLIVPSQSQVTGGDGPASGEPPPGDAAHDKLSDLAPEVRRRNPVVVGGYPADSHPRRPAQRTSTTTRPGSSRMKASTSPDSDRAREKRARPSYGGHTPTSVTLR
jgi:phage shock protein C